MAKNIAPINIGRSGWEERVNKITCELHPDFWNGFRPVPHEEICSVEKTLNRKLPQDFIKFLEVFGAGNFPDEFGGDIYSPQEIIDGCAGPLLMLLGSDSWASADEQRKFYTSRGVLNPNPSRFVNDVTVYNGIDLLDLIQMGTDGMCCYYQVSCIDSRCPIKFAKITPEATFEEVCPSFSAGLDTILSRFSDMISDDS